MHHFQLIYIYISQFKQILFIGYSQIKIIFSMKYKWSFYGSTTPYQEFTLQHILVTDAS